jgi:hypothetical protein
MDPEPAVYYGARKSAQEIDLIFLTVIGACALADLAIGAHILVFEQDPFPHGTPAIYGVASIWNVITSGASLLIVFYVAGTSLFAKSIYSRAAHLASLGAGAVFWLIGAVLSGYWVSRNTSFAWQIDVNSQSYQYKSFRDYCKSLASI